MQKANFFDTAAIYQKRMKYKGGPNGVMVALKQPNVKFLFLAGCCGLRHKPYDATRRRAAEKWM